ncbi:hypothetical protein GCM10025864_35030 [Luteimicrobium album]|uniref:CdiI immunity protein domain-containing protein n=1 Tax=Luteimicrobium album TaxID=1054550 RepID=A0ABQ6I7J5_9MICO|nr:contact-dependent growth inhibition system immunity protein [Luteimicrobium album]GMA25744.1 hypothetical protein GCM10025864_35030 [Luteimicrobium album]
MRDTLIYLAETYFHQDWDLNAPTPLGVLQSFKESEATETVGSLRADVQSLLAGDPTEERLRDIWFHQGRADWDPTRHGWTTFREWFEAVLRTTC